MSLIEATQTALKAQFWTADTGAGGLNGAGTARVREWYRIDHETYVADRTGARPSVLTEVIERPDDAFGVYGAELIARLHIVTQRDLNYAQINAITDRVETLAKAGGGMVLGDAAARWIYTPMQYQRQIRAGATTSQLHTIIELLFTASEPP